MATPKAGETYTYTGESSIGTGNGAIFPDTEVTVREVVEADTPGAHNNDEDAVVVTFKAPTIVRTDKGNEIGEVDRAFSVGVGEFDNLFTKES